MAKKITELVDLPTPVDADILAIVDDVAGIPTTKKVTVANLLAQAIRDDDVAGTFAGHLHRTGASTYEALKSNLSASVAPAVTDDSNSNYAVGSQWIDTTADKVYICYDASVGAALWQEVGAGGAAADSVILTPQKAIIPSTAGAIKSQIEGTNVSYAALDFDASTDSSASWQFTMPQSYDGNAFDIHVHSYASSITGNALLDIEMMRVAAGQVVDTAFTSLGTLTITPAGTTKQLVIDTDAANTLTGLTGGDIVFLRIRRDADNVSDTMVGDLRVVGLEIDYVPA